jgi:plasmid stability protein
MNLLIRDVPDDVIAGLDAEAGRLGLSRNEYLRRMLTQSSTRARGRVTVDDLARFGDTFAGLADTELMEQAWR